MLKEIIGLDDQLLMVTDNNVCILTKCLTGSHVSFHWLSLMYEHLHGISVTKQLLV